MKDAAKSKKRPAVWKVSLIIAAAMIVITLAAGLLMKSTVKNLGIYDIDFGEYLDYVSGITVRELGYTVDNLTENKEELKTAITQEGSWVHHDLQVLVVSYAQNQTHAIQLGSTYTQDVYVEDVLQGDKDAKGQFADMYVVGGIMAVDGEAQFFGNYGKNVMQPGYRYLVFCEKVENMDELDCVYGAWHYKYRMIYTLFNQLNLDQDDTAPAMGLSDWTNSEFLVNDQSVLDELNSIKHEIIDEWM